MTFDLGNARGTVVIDTRGAEASLIKLNRTLQKTTSQMADGFKGVGQSMRGLGRDLSIATLPLTAFLGTGLKVAQEFDSTMAEISARTGIVGDELKTIEDKALSLGAATKFSSQQSAEAFLQLITAGLETSEAMITVDEVLKAAAASGADLGTTADLVTNIMSSFRLEAKDTAAIVESMNQAAASSPATMEQIGQAMQRVGGIATNFGIAQEDVAAIMAVFAQNGVRGSEAGTQLRSVLRTLTSGTEETNNTLTKLGVSLFDSEGKARDFGVVLGEIAVGMSTLSDTERVDALQNLGGAYGQIGLSALLANADVESANAQMIQANQVLEDRVQAMLNRFGIGWSTAAKEIATEMIKTGDFTRAASEKFKDYFGESLPEDSPLVDAIFDVRNGLLESGFAFDTVSIAAANAVNPIQEMTDVMNGQASATEVAEKRMDTFEGQVTSLKGSIETFQITVMRPFMNDVLKPLVKQLIEVVNGFTAWAKENPKLAQTLIAVASVVTILGPALFTLGIAMTVIGTAISGISTALGVLTPLITLLSGAVGLLSSAFGFLKAQLLAVAAAKAIAFPELAIILAIIVAVTAAVVFLSKVFPEAFKRIGDGLRAFVSDPLKFLIEGFEKFFKLLAIGALVSMRAFVDAVQFIATAIMDFVRDPIQAFTDAFNIVFGAMETFFELVAILIIAPIKAIISVAEKAGDAIEEFGDKIGEFLKEAAGPVGDVLKGIGDFIGFQSGTPFTGTGAASDVAGVVHNREAVIPEQGMRVFPDPSGLRLAGAMAGGTNEHVNIERFEPTVIIDGGDPAQVRPMVLQAMNDFYEAIINKRKGNV